MAVRWLLFAILAVSGACAVDLSKLRKINDLDEQMLARIGALAEQIERAKARTNNLGERYLPCAALRRLRRAAGCAHAARGPTGYRKHSRAMALFGLAAVRRGSSCSHEIAGGTARM